MAGFGFLQDRRWRRKTLSDAFGWSFLGFLVFAVLVGGLCWFIKGPDIFRHALIGDQALLLSLLPRVAVALSIASLIWVMLPRDRLSALVGADSGVKGVSIATLAGTVTPGGPASAYPLLSVLASSGAGRGAMVAYITAWATLGMQRILIWDVPFMGAEFAMLRLLVSLPLPIIAGLIAIRLPMTVKYQEPGA